MRERDAFSLWKKPRRSDVTESAPSLDRFKVFHRRQFGARNLAHGFSLQWTSEPAKAVDYFPPPHFRSRPSLHSKPQRELRREKIAVAARAGCCVLEAVLQLEMTPPRAF